MTASPRLLESRRPPGSARGCPMTSSIVAARDAGELLAARARPARRPVRSATGSRAARAVAERHEVLLGQDLGRRHERRLVAGFDRDERRAAARRSSCPRRRRPAGAGASGAAPPCRRRISVHTRSCAPVSFHGQPRPQSRDQIAARIHAPAARASHPWNAGSRARAGAAGPRRTRGGGRRLQCSHRVRENARPRSPGASRGVPAPADTLREAPLPLRRACASTSRHEQRARAAPVAGAPR